MNFLLDTEHPHFPSDQGAHFSALEPELIPLRPDSLWAGVLEAPDVVKGMHPSLVALQTQIEKAEQLLAEYDSCQDGERRDAIRERDADWMLDALQTHEWDVEMSDITVGEFDRLFPGFQARLRPICRHLCALAGRVLGTPNGQASSPTPAP